jgi:nucleoside-diphosphate-sugar epimerase
VTVAHASSNSSSGDQPIVAITGATGYLGSLLVAAFRSAGFSVRRLVRRPHPESSDQAFRLGSVGPSDALEAVDLLVHCAYDMTLTKRSDIWQTNVFGTAALLDMAVSAGVRKTIVVSSMSAYPGTRQLYGRAKLEIELAALSKGVCVVRPGLVYGSSGGGMAGTLHRLAALPVLPDFGPRAHQFTVHEQDLTSAMVTLALDSKSPTRPVGIAHPDPVPFRALLTSFATSMGKPKPRFVPTPPMAAYGALRAGELLSIKMPVRADSLLGLIRPAPSVPNLDVLDNLGIALQPFPFADSGSGFVDLA